MRRRFRLTCQQLVELVTDYLEGALSRRDRTRFEHAEIVIFWFIDPFGDRSRSHFVGRKRSQDFFSGFD